MSGVPQTSASATSLLLEEEVENGYKANVQVSLQATIENHR